MRRQSSGDCDKGEGGSGGGREGDIGAQRSQALGGSRGRDERDGEGTGSDEYDVEVRVRWRL